MNSKLEDYRKCLLSRQTISNQFITILENCLITEDEAAKHCFHKIMVHHWVYTPEELFDNLSEYLSVTFIPIDYKINGGIASFYTNNLNVILKIMKLDFMFPFQRSMFNIDILFYDKSSADCFEYRKLVDDIVAEVVSRRFNENRELDLSNFCQDPEFFDKKINFYKLGLLSLFKILMLRMGRDTILLKLNNNGLSTIPPEIMNFFIKGDLEAVDLSDNNIAAMSELRVLSKIERLTLEGNPLCDNEDVLSYVKQITFKFPRLKELDGIPINQYGIIFPFWQNYLVSNDRKSRMLVEKFIMLYFTHYDTSRKDVINFYHDFATLTIASNLDVAANIPHYSSYSRNIMGEKRNLVLENKNILKGNQAIVGLFLSFPETVHDPKTFTVDLVKNDRRNMIIIVDGIFKERVYDSKAQESIFQFRRTFVFECCPQDSSTVYYITNEMFNVTLANQEQIYNSFILPTRNLNTLELINPEKEEINSVAAVFSHITNLKQEEAELRLRIHNWDLKRSLLSFKDEIRNNKISADKFIEYDISDMSSLDDID